MNTRLAHLTVSSGLRRPSKMLRALYPLRFEPILKRLIWGGRRLQTLLDKPLGPGDDYAESWEIADHGDDVSRVAAGMLLGRSLRELLADDAPAILGRKATAGAQFPLLLKFLDAHQDLSIQVHPNNKLARRLANDNGKTEAWVILHAEPASWIYAGLQPGMTHADVVRALKRGELPGLLHRFPARAGDTVFIPAGTVHAIGAGIVLAEVQQQSDATFRLDDWGRVDREGRPRPLQIPQALESIDFDLGPVQPILPSPEPEAWGTRERLITCPYFEIERLTLRGTTEIGSIDRCTILVGLDGIAELHHGRSNYVVRKGETLLLPAAIGPCAIGTFGAGTVLTCVVP
jgi:mannose-6-phosphate isomerase